MEKLKNVEQKVASLKSGSEKIETPGTRLSRRRAAIIRAENARFYRENRVALFREE